MSRGSIRKGVAEWRNGQKYCWPMWSAWSKGNRTGVAIFWSSWLEYLLCTSWISDLYLLVQVFTQKDFETDLNSKHGHISLLPLWYCIYVSMETCVHLRGRAEVVMAHIEAGSWKQLYICFKPLVVLSSVVHLYSTYLKNTGKSETVWGSTLYYLSKPSLLT